MKNISKDNLSVKLSEEQISKIKELIKEKKLSDTLIKKPEFIKDVKNILKSELNLEVTDEDIQDLLKDVEKTVGKEPLEVLDENELSEAVGGVSFKGVRNTVIIGMSSLLGGDIGIIPGNVIGNIIGLNTGNIKYDREKNKLTPNDKQGEKIINRSEVAGLLGGMCAGAAIGLKIINYLDS